jgi:Polyketide synthase dehydratase
VSTLVQCFRGSSSWQGMHTSYLQRCLCPLRMLGRHFPTAVLANVFVDDFHSSKKYVFNPMAMDAAIHFAAFHMDVVQNPNPNSLFLPSKLGSFAFYEAPKADERIFSHMLLRDWTPGNEFLWCSLFLVEFRSRDASLRFHPL